MQLYAITDRRLYAAGEPYRSAALLEQAERWADAGVSILQVREKDLSPQALEDLTARLVEAVHRAGSGRMRLLLNTGDNAGAIQMARRTGANGVHLPAEWRSSIAAVRAEWTGAGAAKPCISVACHTAAEAATAAADGASLVLFAPVFGKLLTADQVLPGSGLAALADACTAAAPAPVFALGGVTEGNAHACIAAGAVGVAGIRLFAGDHWSKLIER